jgi:predicted DNA-binding transcriptional regulator AlpA
MLEHAIEKLTTEVQKLREAVELQTSILQRQYGVRAVSVAAVREEPNAYLPERAVADLAGLSVATLRRWRLFRQGPPFKKFGSCVRYSRAEVLAWLEAQ